MDECYAQTLNDSGTRNDIWEREKILDSSCITKRHGRKKGTDNTIHLEVF